MPDTKPPKPQTFMFADDGSVPNNAHLPFALYRRAIDLIGSPDPEQVIENVFRRNGGRDMWRNGIFPYVHHHSMIHEGMGIARGAPMSASAATRARGLLSLTATFACCRPAPGINASRPLPV